MIKVTYFERTYLDKYRCIDKVKEIRALSVLQSGELLYYKINSFEYKVIPIHSIISEVRY